MTQTDAGKLTPSPEMLELADWIAKQREFHQNSIACKDPILVMHIERLQRWENACRASSSPSPDAGLREALDMQRAIDGVESMSFVSAAGPLEKCGDWKYLKRLVAALSPAPAMRGEGG